MKRFSNYTILKEDSRRKRIKEEDGSEKALEIISILSDEKFGNEGQRKKFISMITNLFSLSDPVSRKFIRKLGDACTLIAQEMVGNAEEGIIENDLENDLEMEDDTFNYAGDYENQSYFPEFLESSAPDLSDQDNSIDSDEIKDIFGKADVEDVVDEDEDILRVTESSKKKPYKFEFAEDN